MQPEIAFSAADTAEDVQRCIAVLLSTRAGSVAMDREFGLSWDFVDLPVEAAQAALTAEIVAKVAKYEPRERDLYRRRRWYAAPPCGGDDQ